VGCSSDDFAVRPNSLSVSSSASADATGLLSGASPAIKTGANFSLSAASDVLGYATVPKLDATKLSAHSGATKVGALSGSFGNANAATGIATASGFAYSEVGYFRFAANGMYDDSFTAVDSATGDCTADFSNTAVGGKYGCNFGNAAQTSYFGRFIPDHFDVAVGTQGAMAPACLAGSFTYTGQAMGYTTAPTLSITPINASSGTGVTSNYVGIFQKLSAAGVQISAPTADATQKGKDGTSLTTLSASLGVGSLSNSAGVMTYALKSNDLFTYSRNLNAMVAPYTSTLTLTTTAVSDGEVLAASLPTLQPTGASIRFGRLRLQNVFGSERLPLAIPVQAQHYVTNAAGTSYFTDNADDHCTPLSLPLARTLLANAKPDGAANMYFYPLVSGKNQLLSSAVTAAVPAKLFQGKATLQFAATGKQGWLDLILTVPDYLAYNWGNCNGQGSDSLMNDLPCARATFGVLGTKSPIIYMRENY
jgi:MSHA biogenesis protein MshQ